MTDIMFLDCFSVLSGDDEHNSFGVYAEKVIVESSNTPTRATGSNKVSRNKLVNSRIYNGSTEIENIWHTYLKVGCYISQSSLM